MARRSSRSEAVEAAARQALRYPETYAGTDEGPRPMEHIGNGFSRYYGN